VYSLRDKVVLLTGATGGLGQVLARRFAVEGAQLILTGRSMSALVELIATLPDPTRATALDGELHHPGEASRLASAAEEVHGRVDLLVNNAGMGYFALVEEATDEGVRELFELNTFTPMTLMRALVPGMKARGEGRIVNVASAAGRVPIPTVGIYGGSKSALAMMANTMRFELEPAGIAIVNVYPGTIDTAFEVNALRERERGGLDPHRRRGRPVEEIAARIVAASKGRAREVWLERRGFWMAVGSLLWPRRAERKLRRLRDRAVAFDRVGKPPEERRWRLWQVESSLACELSCAMCPWPEERKAHEEPPLMPDAVWSALRPHLGEVATLDLSGGGEPLLHPALVARVVDAKAAGCEVGFLTNGMLFDEERTRELLAAGVDWLAFSIDGADAATFETIRVGGSFERVTANLRRLNDLRGAGRPRTAINFVILRANAHQLEAIVRLAAQLGVDQVNFKQCDVSRGEHGRGQGFVPAAPGEELGQLEKALERARRLARKLKIDTTAFSFVPEELAVCEQDPTSSLFIRWDGRVAPCINQAYGGETHFLGRDAHMPTVHYGAVPNDSVAALWEGEACRHYRETFSNRIAAHDRQLLDLGPGATLEKLQEAFARARDAMPPPPRGCEVCHYLRGV
jgi:short-subunit dehydrogenase/MoaA/NifB/PqqE/SkfB family radical SAM enzyme